MSRTTSAGDEVFPLAHLFNRLSDPVRLRVLFALADGAEHSPDVLAAALGATRFAVGQHLRELARIGLVSGARDGTDKCFWLAHGVRGADGVLSLGKGLRVAARPLAAPWSGV